jgi:hypothetical protein
VFTPKQVAALNGARTVLDQLEREASRVGLARLRAVVVEGPDAIDFGRIAACADLAGQVLFDLLNTANAHRVAELSDDVLHNRVPAEPAETVPAGELAELRDEVHVLSAAHDRLAAAMTPDAALGSRRVGESFYPSFCRVCGHSWENASEPLSCPECDADGIDVVHGPLATMVSS